MSDEITSASGVAPDCATVAQVAAYLKVSPKQVRFLISNRKLPAVRIGKILRVRLADFEAFLTSHRC